MKNKTASWVFFADKDILMAKTAIGHPELTGGVLFHCQQAIEKYLKAYLVEHGKEVHKIHDLLILYSDVKSIQNWNLDENLLEKISDIYITVRYPINLAMKQDGMLPTIEEAKRYLEFTLEVEKTFYKLLGNEAM